MNLAQMSLTGSAFILFVLVLRILAGRRLPKGVFWALWEIAALRLLIPFSLSSPFSLYGYLTPGMEQQREAAGSGLLLSSFSADASAFSSLALVWLAGTCCLGAYFLALYVKSMGRFRLSLPAHSAYIAGWLNSHKLFRPVQVRVSDRILSPVTYGVLRPVILLPRGIELENSSVLPYVLTHEYMHIRRFDAVTKLLLAAALCLHWFNPLVWVLYFFANRDLELSCDELVVQAVGQKGRSAYALALIDMEEWQSARLSLHSHFSRQGIEERTLSIMRYKKRPAWMMVLAAVPIALFSFALLTSPSPSFPQTSAEKGQFCRWEDLPAHLDGLQQEVSELAEQGQLTRQQADQLLAGFRGQLAGLEQARDAGNVLVVDRAEPNTGRARYSLDQLCYLPFTADGLPNGFPGPQSQPKITAVLPQGAESGIFMGDF